MKKGGGVQRGDNSERGYWNGGGEAGLKGKGEMGTTANSPKSKGEKEGPKNGEGFLPVHGRRASTTKRERQGKKRKEGLRPNGYGRGVESSHSQHELQKV